MIKTLGKQVKQYKGASIATPIFMVLEVICETIIPLLMASMTESKKVISTISIILPVGCY